MSRFAAQVLLAGELLKGQMEKNGFEQYFSLSQPFCNRNRTSPVFLKTGL
jgi:hypothetical protein